MRRVQVLGVLGGVLVLGLGEGCERRDVLTALQKPPPALGLERPTPSLAPVSTKGAGSSIALVKRGERRLALVADADAKVVRMLDTRTDEELHVTPLEGSPSQLVVSGDGRVYVALRDRAEVDVLEVTPDSEPALRVAARVATAEEPTALSLTPDGRSLLVACGWGHALDVFATSTLEHRFRAGLAREPRAVVTSDDGALAYVSHASASLVSVVDLEAPEHEVDAVRLDQPDFQHDGRLQWRQGYALASTEFGVLAPGVTAETGDTTVRTETYGGVGAFSEPAESFAVNVVHPHAPGGRGEGDVPARTIAVGGGNPCLLPRAAAYDPDGQWLLVACQGQDQVLRLDARLAGGAGRQASWQVGGQPTGLAIDPAARAVYVWSQQSHTVTALDLDAYHPAPVAGDDAQHAVVLGPRVEVPGAVALGRELFHRTGDARISSDGRACASCHPDGRDDGLVWATPDGPRQTPTLAGRLAGTAPYGWNGARQTVKQHVTGTLARLGGTGLDDASMDALVAYCMHMDAPPRASDPVTGEDPGSVAAADPLVAEGRDLFESSATGCGSCHMSDGTFTDGNRHDVKSKAKGDPHRRFDTPSLRFVAGTAPYFHDGRYPTLRALLVGSDGKMGHTAKLSSGQLDALEAYLKTL
jgi:DNA-binding beta-propeller fold protein YncE/mono/diheme cytochrome c family protein